MRPSDLAITVRINTVYEAIVFLRMLWESAYKRQMRTALNPDDFGEKTAELLRKQLYSDDEVNEIMGVKLDVTVKRVKVGTDEKGFPQYECRISGDFDRHLPRTLRMIPLQAVMTQYEHWHASALRLRGKVLNIGITKTAEMGTQSIGLKLVDPCGRSFVDLSPVGTDSKGRATFRILISDVTLLWGTKNGIRFYISAAGSKSKYLYDPNNDSADVEGYRQVLGNNRSDEKERYSEIWLLLACPRVDTTSR
jgi:hypothetical protein